MVAARARSNCRQMMQRFPTEHTTAQMLSEMGQIARVVCAYSWHAEAVAWREPVDKLQRGSNPDLCKDKQVEREMSLSGSTSASIGLALVGRFGAVRELGIVGMGWHPSRG